MSDSRSPLRYDASVSEICAGMNTEEAASVRMDAMRSSPRIRAHTASTDVVSCSIRRS